MGSLCHNVATNNPQLSPCYEVQRKGQPVPGQRLLQREHVRKEQEWKGTEVKPGPAHLYQASGYTLDPRGLVPSLFAEVQGLAAEVPAKEEVKGERMHEKT